MSETKQNESRPELLCIGFLCHDLHEGKYILGGTASYSSIMASHLGMRTAILTSVGPDFKFYYVFEKHSIDVHKVLARQTTIFENLYDGEIRQQYIHSRATTLLPTQLPSHWQAIPVIKFCLIADEVDITFLQQFPDALIGATIQGWLRQWDEQGKITPKAMDWEMLQYIDIVFMSVDDIAGFEWAIPRMAELVSLLIVTNGKEGALLYIDGETKLYPAFPTTEVDPTGAGDIFAASFLVKYHQTQNCDLAMAYAHAAASYIVEDYGIHLPSLEAIEKRFDIYLKGG